MNNFIDSIKNLKTFEHPFKHWEIDKPLDEKTIEEINSVLIPEGRHEYDGTRAADYTGGGVDGKLRVFINKNNTNSYPKLTGLIKTLQSKDCQSILSSYLKKDLNNSYVRLEIIGDKKGFWLKPHKDIIEKTMTMMIWTNPYNESEELGTDFYNENFVKVKTSKYINNKGYFFSSGSDTWHGLEKKEIIKERRCIQINYVTFETDWPVE